MTVINIARDFTQFPTGRYRKFGKGSGEEFRDKFLLPHLSRGEKIIVELDGTSGYPSSFLEEAFGGLVRAGVPATDLRKLMTIESGPEFKSYESLIWRYVDSASPEHAL